jgi:hypothetical protein
VLAQRCVDNFVIGFEKREQIDETLNLLKRILAQ